MVTEIVTFKVAPGKVAQALQWVAKVAVYVKKATPSWQLSVLEPIGTDDNVTLVNQCPSLSDFEEAMTRRSQDPGWLAIGKEGRDSDWYRGFTRQFYRAVG
jgi:hypothetical protein